MSQAVVHYVVRDEQLLLLEDVGVWVGDSSLQAGTSAPRSPPFQRRSSP
jgi:hypothetical protein